MPNTDQIEYWNSEAGHNWVRNADQLDVLLRPFLDRILDRASLSDGEHVLDIGCGAGALTLQAAQVVGEKRGAVGVDISAPLIELSRKRASELNLPATFVLDDASVFRAEKRLDAAISRFGVMFFDEPVQAFTALRRNLRPEGRFVFACWAPLAENLWARFALDAVREHLSELPAPPPPGTPGPFALADLNTLSAILRDAGWCGVQIEAFRPDLPLPGETIAETAEFLMEMGPAARLLREQALDPGLVRKSICERLQDIPVADGVRKLASSAWVVSASAS
jgi:SAM-dependent methyltransferase